jgi:hypothetical protein
LAGVFKKSLNLENIKFGKTSLGRIERSKNFCALIDMDSEKALEILTLISKSQLPSGIVIKECDALPSSLVDEQQQRSSSSSSYYQRDNGGGRSRSYGGGGSSYGGSSGSGRSTGSSSSSSYGSSSSSSSGSRSYGNSYGSSSGNNNNSGGGGGRSYSEGAPSRTYTSNREKSWS